MLRIAMLSLHTSPLAQLGGKKTGGMNVYVREVARTLGEAGHQVDVFTREDSLATQGAITPINDKARVIHLPAGPAQPLDPAIIYRYLPQFRDALLAFAATHQQRYDIIYSHYWLSGWVALALKTAWQIPIVQMFHTLGRMKDRISGTENPATPSTIPLGEPNIRVAVETELMNFADCLIAATPAERMQMLWLYRADRRRITVVPPGVDLKHFQPIDPALARPKICLEPHQRTLLFVGRIEPLKGVDILCYALAILKNNRPDLLDGLVLHIVGGEPGNAEAAHLRNLCNELGLDKLVCFFGAKGQDELPFYYSAAEALIMPSDYESFGMVALEAMACGTPVIASQVGGLAFLVQDDETGFHVPVREPDALAQRIAILLTDQEKRRSMGINARRVAETYSWETIARQLINTFCKVLPACH